MHTGLTGRLRAAALVASGLALIAGYPSVASAFTVSGTDGSYIRKYRVDCDEGESVQKHLG